MDFCDKYTVQRRVDKPRGRTEYLFMNKSFPDMALQILQQSLMHDSQGLLMWMALGVAVVFAAFALKFSLNVMNAGFPSFFGALVATILGGGAMLGGATLAIMLLGKSIPGDLGPVIVKSIGAFLGLLVVGAPLAAFLCRSKYMAALGSWFVGLVVAFVGVLAFNAATSGLKASEKAIDRGVERRERLERAVQE